MGLSAKESKTNKRVKCENQIKENWIWMERIHKQLG
jgi:hypothetical protein